MADTCPVSLVGEARLRMAFKLIRCWTSVGLVGRLLQADIGVPTANAAHILMSNATRVGLLVRSGSKRMHTYTLTEGWKHPSGRAQVAVPCQRAKAERRAPCARRDAIALLTTMPAQMPGPLTPSLGTRDADGVDADGELLPCIGGAIVDRLRSSFDVLFVAAE